MCWVLFFVLMKNVSTFQVYISLFIPYIPEVLNTILTDEEKAQFKKCAPGDKVTNGTAGIWIFILSSGAMTYYSYVASS